MELMHMHTIGAAEEITLVELDVDSHEESQEVQHQEILGGEPEADHLPECPDHQPATFMKGKSRSIISLPILLMSPKLLVLLHYVIGVVWEPLLHNYLSLSRNIYPESYLSPGTLLMLSYA